MNLSNIQHNPYPEGYQVFSRPYLHGYAACLLRGNQIIWKCSRAFGAVPNDSFNLKWDFSGALLEDSFKVIGYITNLQDDAIPVSFCEGVVSTLFNKRILLLETLSSQVMGG